MSFYKAGSNSKLVVRITLLGDKKTGKKSLLKTYSGEIKDKKTELTDSIGSAYCINTVVDDTPIELNVKILESINKQMAVMAWAHGGIVIYSTNSKESFKIAEECISEIKRVTMRDALIVLVANNMGGDRIVSAEDGKDLSVRYECSYIELSAINDKTDVSNVIYELSQQILIRGGLMKAALLKKPPKLFRWMVEAVRRNSGPNVRSTLCDDSLPVVKEVYDDPSSKFLEDVVNMKETKI